jgi:hypothetical protein
MVATRYLDRRCGLKLILDNDFTQFNAPCRRVEGAGGRPPNTLIGGAIPITFRPDWQGVARLCRRVVYGTVSWPKDDDARVRHA